MHLDILIPADATSLKWKPAYARLETILQASGITVGPLPWTSPEAKDAPVVAALLAWGYHNEPARWSAYLADRQGHGTTLNPPAVMAWNTDKVYLRDVARHAPTVPTVYVDRLTDDRLDELRAELGSTTLIAKPRMGASADGVVRITGALEGSRENVMVQPFLSAIATEGELSLIFIAGRFSHAVRKRVRAGDFRVQSEFGGSVEAYTPTPALIDMAQASLGAAPGEVVYARVDLVPNVDGSWMVIELELIEPELFLDHAPDKGQALAHAIRAAIDAGTST